MERYGGGHLSVSESCSFNNSPASTRSYITRMSSLTLLTQSHGIRIIRVTFRDRHSPSKRNDQYHPITRIHAGHLYTRRPWPPTATSSGISGDDNGASRCCRRCGVCGKRLARADSRREYLCRLDLLLYALLWSFMGTDRMDSTVRNIPYSSPSKRRCHQHRLELDQQLLHRVDHSSNVGRVSLGNVFVFWDILRFECDLGVDISSRNPTGGIRRYGLFLIFFSN